MTQCVGKKKTKKNRHHNMPSFLSGVLHFKKTDVPEEMSLQIQILPIESIEFALPKSLIRVSYLDFKAMTVG